MIWITLIAQISLSQTSVSYILEVEEMYQQGSLQKVIETTSQILNYEPHNEKAKFYLILSQNEVLANELESKGEYKEALKLWLLILNSYPDNIRAKKAIMRLMERGLDFYIDKPYNLLY
jgi:tetratricopeptide (TPR) repeat protein